MRARTNPLAFISILTGGAFALTLVMGGATAGCGSKTDEGAVTPVDSGGPGFVDAKDSSAPPDTMTTPMDTEPVYDVPGSLFDAVLPDITFEGGKTLDGCFDCTTDKCKSQVEACDAEPRCRGLVLCMLAKCGGSTTDFGCLLGCAGEYGVSSPSDPIATKGLAVGSCIQSNCASACPIPADGGMMGDTRTDTAAEAAVDSAASETADGSAFMIFPKSGAEQAKSIDPELTNKLVEIAASFSAMSPAARESVITKFSSH